MKLIYSNYDGLDVAFQGALPQLILEQLEMGRTNAENNKRETLVHLGENEIPVMVAETGARGGYRYRFDTGIDRETWFVVKSTNPEMWNIRVSTKSMSLAFYGYLGVKENILNTLKELGAFGINEETGELIDELKESISRFDFCFDFEAEDFIPNEKHLITHNRSKKKTLYEGETIFSGNNLIYLRVGTMPNRQIVLYNKIKEITEKNKSYWYKIWGINKNKLINKIWRIEARAGKKELKKWNLRTFNDFENKSGDVIISILKEIKYIEPNNDKNRSRWPLSYFWNIAINSAENKLEEYISNAKRGEIIRATRKEIQERYKKHIIGMASPLAVALGHEDISQIPVVLEGVKKEIEILEKTDPNSLNKKIKKSKERFIFLDDKKNYFQS